MKLFRVKKLLAFYLGAMSGMVLTGLDFGNFPCAEAASGPNELQERRIVFQPGVYFAGGDENQVSEKTASSQEPTFGNPHPNLPSLEGPSLEPEKPLPSGTQEKSPKEPSLELKIRQSGPSLGAKEPKENAENPRPVKNKKEEPLMPKVPASSKPSLPPLGPEWKALADAVSRALQSASKIAVNTRDHTPADLLAWALVWGCEAEAAYGGPGGKPVNVLAILCHNYSCAERQLLLKHDGHFGARFGYGYQTQRGQFLAVLAWARVPKEYPLQIGQQTRTVADLVEYEKLHCRSGLDQSQVLVGLSFYLEKQEESSWQNNQGESWSLERLLSEELKGPIAGAADGGLHRLMGLSYALHARRKHNLPWSPLCEQVDRYLLEYQKHAFRCQNNDGSWNPAFFEAVGPSTDSLGTLRATGHIFRWLAFSLPEPDLYDPRMYKAARTLVGLLEARRSWQSGGRSPLEWSATMHALHGLALYEERALLPRLQNQGAP